MGGQERSNKKQTVNESKSPPLSWWGMSEVFLYGNRDEFTANYYTFNMTTLRDLIRAGHIQAEEQIQWVRPRMGLKHHAVVNANGQITTEDGVIHRSPSGAARHFYQKPIDGWSAWKVIRTGQSLSEIRKLVN